MRTLLSVVSVVGMLLLCACCASGAAAPLHNLEWCKATFECTVPGSNVMSLYTNTVDPRLGYGCWCSGYVGLCQSATWELGCVGGTLPNCVDQYKGEEEAAKAGSVYGYCKVCALTHQLSNYPYSSPTCILCSGAVPNCVLCSADSVCSQCNAGYTLSLAKNTCIPCAINGCASCSADNVCSACNSGYTLSTDQKSCFSCPIANCQGCTANGVCGSCTPGYSLSPDKKACFKCPITGCASCSADNVCGSCKSGYTLLADQNTCLECSTAGCKTCSADNVCSACQDGYTLSSDGKKCFSCPIAHCEGCTADGVCGSCPTGYTLWSDKRSCFECGVGGCTACSADGVCARCEAGLTLATDKHSCFTCTLDNCAMCAYAGVCGVCADGYVLSETGLCGVCDVPLCAECVSPGDGHRCAKCTKGYKADKKSGECVARSIGWWVWLLVAIAVVLIVGLAIALVYRCCCRSRKRAATRHAEVVRARRTPLQRVPLPAVDVEFDDKEPEVVRLVRVPSQRRRRVSVGGETVLGTNAQSVPQFPNFYTDATLPADSESGGHMWPGDLPHVSQGSNPFSQFADDVSLCNSCDN